MQNQEFSYLVNSTPLCAFCSLVLSPVQPVLKVKQNYCCMKKPISIKQKRNWIFVAETILLHKCKSWETPLKSIFCLGSTCTEMKSESGCRDQLQGYTISLAGETQTTCFSWKDLRLEEMKRSPVLKYMFLLRGREERWQRFGLGRWYTDAQKEG